MNLIILLPKLCTLYTQLCTQYSSKSVHIPLHQSFSKHRPQTNSTLRELVNEANSWDLSQVNQIRDCRSGPAICLNKHPWVILMHSKA
jgi:hypothetical protein